MKTNSFFFYFSVFSLLKLNYKENTWYKVSKITDGDTFFMSLLHHQKKYKIRLIGIDAPETRNVGVKVRKEYFGTEAKIFVTQLLKNKR